MDAHLVGKFREDFHEGFRHQFRILCFFFNDTATTEIYTLCLHDALPIYLFACRPIPTSRGAPALTLLERSTNLPETIYDIAIVGSGPAGYTAAIRAGQLGLKAALIEKDPYLGGTCLHVGCIPTKALLFNAEVFDHVKEGVELGLENTAGVSLNWGAIQKRKQGIVDKHAKGLVFLMKKNKVDVVRGYGKLTGPAKDGIHTVALEGGELKSI